jgi:hypothetical protein
VGELPPVQSDRAAVENLTTFQAQLVFHQFGDVPRSLEGIDIALARLTAGSPALVLLREGSCQQALNSKASHGFAGLF